MSVVAHFFMSVGGSEIHERLAHFFIDFYMGRLELPASRSRTVELNFFRLFLMVFDPFRYIQFTLCRS